MLTHRRLHAAAFIAATFVVSSLSGAVADHGTWGAVTGPAEPNTSWDHDATRMQQTVNAAPVEKVYFNGFIINGDHEGDIQLEGGTVLSASSNMFAALLGFWRDCNGDGYIGAKGTGASQGSFSVYPRALHTIDETICPLGSPYNTVNEVTRQPNGFIDEFRWIGNFSVIPSQLPKTCIPPNQNPPTNTGLCVSASTATAQDPHDVSDQNAHVWVDWNYPGGKHIPHQGLTAQPPGTYDDSDGSLKYVDDALQRQVSGSAPDTWASKPAIGKCDYPPTFGGGPDTVVTVGSVSHNAGGTCGYWPLYQVEHKLDDRNPDHDKDNASAAVQVFDVENDRDGSGTACDDGFRFAQPIPNPLGSRPLMDGIGLPRVDPKVHPNLLVEGSILGTTSNVYRGTNGTAPEGKRCATGHFGAGSPESTALDAEFTHRLPTDVLEFVTDQRYRFLAAQGFDYAPYDLLGIGVRSGPAAPAGDSPGWYGNYGWTGRPPRTGYGSLTAIHATFYADVSAASVCRQPCPVVTNNTLADDRTALPAGAQDAHIYGVEFCDSFTSGPSNVNPKNDWDCSLDVWKAKRTDPGPLPSGYRIIGDRYDLRDVDCYDNTVTSRAPGVRLGVADCTAATSR